MSVRSKTGHQRCDTCRLHPGVCICGMLPNLRLKTQLTLIMHRRENGRTTNTGALTLACVANSNKVLYPNPDGPAFHEGETPVLLFPHSDAVPLDQFVSQGPIRLIIPDGTWRNANKIRNRMPGLAHLPCVIPPPGPPSIYRLRHVSRPDALSTMEAAARALGVLEGPAVRKAMEHVFRIMHDRLLWLKGQLEPHLVFGGLPESARRHDPNSGFIGNGGNHQG